jgi:SNF2 family DNA or RNA helicase
MGTGVKFHVLLTTPELAMMDTAHLEPICRAMIAVDEAHRLENKVNELHMSLAVIFSANRLLVLGTHPLHISVAELWELLKILNPDQFDDPVAFEDSFSFSPLGDEEHVAELHSTLRPNVIQRQGRCPKGAPEEYLKRVAGLE